MIFSFGRIKLFFMGGLILFISLIAGTYVCSALFTIVVFRIFFPLKAKEKVENHEMTLTYSRTSTLSSTKNKVHLLSVDGRR
jgi:hypothetical protein